VLVLGTLGSNAVLEPDRIAALPLEAEFSEALGPYDKLSTLPDGYTDNHYIDWQLSGFTQESAIADAVGRTMRTLADLAIDVHGIALKGARVTSDEDLFERPAQFAWPDMEDHTALAQELASSRP
jgi:hypothetical protein